jgi:hypothetical protein
MGAGKDDSATRLVLAAYIAIASAPFMYAAAHARFWEQRHYREPVATAVFAILLIALMLRRRWAWVLLTVFTSIIVISYAWEGGSVIGLLGSLVSLGLLVSAHLRHHAHIGRRSSGS